MNVHRHEDGSMVLDTAARVLMVLTVLLFSLVILEGTSIKLNTMLLISGLPLISSLWVLSWTAPRSNANSGELS